MRLRFPGRLEWKILGAASLIAALSVGTAFYALEFTLRRFSEFSVAHGERIGEASTKAAEVFRAYFAERKEAFRRRAEALAASPPERMQALAAVDGLLRARLLEGGEVVDAWEAPREVVARAREAPAVPVLVPGETGGSPRVLELTFGIPHDMYTAFLDLGRAIDEERQIDRAYGALAPRFVSEYLVFVVSILALAPLVGFLLARRMTRRVARLRDAAARVGEGDLTVQVAPKGKDELDELGRVFDRMVAELAQARSRLEYLQKVSAWQEVARRLAHEIKNPLTPIQLAMQELASKYRGGDPGYQRLLDTAMEILNEEISSLRRLVDDFSAFAKLPKVSPQPLDLGAFVAETVRLQPEWQGQVEVAPAAGEVRALCDRTLFRRVIANLVENAVQAARGAGRAPLVRISVESRAQADRVAVMVDDNGPGVPQAERRRVFDPYVTGREGGTGLGLAIVRKIVIDHGGDVTISQAPPPLGGARFTIELPARAAP